MGALDFHRSKDRLNDIPVRAIIAIIFIAKGQLSYCLPKPANANISVGNMSI